MPIYYAYLYGSILLGLFSASGSDTVAWLIPTVALVVHTLSATGARYLLHRAFSLSPTSHVRLLSCVSSAWLSRPGEKYVLRCLDYNYYCGA